MIISKMDIPEVLLLEPKVYGDERGYFMETFRSSHFKEIGLNFQFVQDNQSRSRRGTLRGLHFQHRKPQGKLVRVVSGEVFDVAVDIRKSSPMFGMWVGERLSSENHKQLWIPPGFAHGFYVLSDYADIAYKCTDYYCGEDEFSLFWDDPELSIAWPTDGQDPLLSERDRLALSLNELPEVS